MRLQQNPRLKRLLKPSPVRTRHHYKGVRIHHVVWRILDNGESALRRRYPASDFRSGDFIGPAITELDRRKLIHKVEVRVNNFPMFTRPEHMTLARAQGGTAIWLPSVALEKMEDQVWEKVRPKWKNGKVVWS